MSDNDIQSTTPKRRPLFLIPTEGKSKEQLKADLTQALSQHGLLADERETTTQVCFTATALIV